MEKDEHDLYFCDPRKNTKCTKEFCKWNCLGKGECFATKDKTCAFDHKPTPLTEYQYDILDEDTPWFHMWYGEVGKDIQEKCFVKEKDK